MRCILLLKIFLLVPLLVLSQGTKVKVLPIYYDNTDGTDLPMVLHSVGHNGIIWDMSLSPDERSIITAGQDKTIRLWDVDSDQQRGEVLGHIGDSFYGAATAARISPDGKWIATTGYFGDAKHHEYLADIRIYDYQSQEIKGVFIGHNNVIFQLRWSEDSRYLISAGVDKTIKVWDMTIMQLKTTLSGHGDKIMSIATHRNQVVSGSKDNLVMLWDINSSRVMATSYDHIGEVMAVAYHPSGQYIFSAATDMQINIYDGSLNYLDSKFLDQTVSTLSVSPDGNYVLAGRNDGGVEVYRFSAGSMELVTQYQPHKGGFVTGVEMTSDQRIISAGGTESNIAIYQLSNDEVHVLHDVEGSTQKVWGAGLNDDLLVMSTSSKGAFTYNKNFDFQRGFNIVSRDYRTLDANNEVMKMTVGKGLTDRTAKYRGKVYNFKLPITRMGALKATQNEKKIVVTYEPLGNDDSWTMQKGKFTGFQNGDIVTQIYDATNKHSFTFTPDSLLIVAGSGGYLKAFDLNGKLVSNFVGHEDVVFTVNLSDDGEWVISGSHDHSIRLWDAYFVGKVPNIRPAATCNFTNDGEWIVATDEGYYMSSHNGGQYIGFHQNQGFRKEAKFYPFENFDLIRNRPDKVLKRLGMGSERLHEIMYLAYQKRLRKMGFSEAALSSDLNLPTVSINTVTQTVNDKMYSLDIMASDSKYLLDRINVYINDVPIYGASGIALSNTQSISESIEIELMTGKNKVQVSVLNQAGVASLKETVIVYYDGIAIKPDLHIVTIGVSNYMDSEYNLDYAAKDANDVSNLFFGHHERYNKIHLYKFTDALAQRDQILAVKSQLSKSKVNDQVIIFAAGHGLLDANLDYYFATQNVDFDDPANKGLKFEELEGLLDGIPARRKLLLIDACHSGEVDKEETVLVKAQLEAKGVSVRGFTKKPQAVGIDNIFELMQELFADLRRSTGAVVISSASGMEFALESAEWKNGVFTYALLEGLSTGNCDSDQDGEIRLSELRDYVFDRVSKLTNGQQHPTSRRENLEFDFVVW